MKRPIGFDKIFGVDLLYSFTGESFRTNPARSRLDLDLSTRWPSTVSETKNLIWIHPVAGYCNSDLLGENVLCLHVNWSECKIETAVLKVGCGHAIRRLLPEMPFTIEDVQSLNAFMLLITNVMRTAAFEIKTAGIYK